MNGGAYTVWHHRWELVSALGVDLAEEPGTPAPWRAPTPKTTRWWNHMRLCSQGDEGERRRGAGDVSLGTQRDAHTRIALMLDAKNIHAWTQRAWAVRTFGRWTEEMDFTER